MLSVCDDELGLLHVEEGHLELPPKGQKLMRFEIVLVQAVATRTCEYHRA